MYVTPFVTVGWDHETGGYSGEYGVMSRVCSMMFTPYFCGMKGTFMANLASEKAQRDRSKV